MSEHGLKLLEGAYEFHTHPAPSHYDRKLDDFEYAKALDQYKMAGSVIKTHFGSTTTRTILTNRYSGCHAKLFGSITLDWPVGGLNPYAVESELLLGGRVVWMPTFHARNHFQVASAAKPIAGPGITVIGEDGKLRGEVYRIIELVRDHNAVLGTGHLSAEESKLLCTEARKIGADIVLTHPDGPPDIVPKDLQIALAEKGVYIEKCWLNVYKNETTADDIADKIRAIGVSHCVMCTDLGNRKDISAPDGMLQFVDALLERGFTDDEIRTMSSATAKYLLRV